MDKETLIGYLERIDAALAREGVLFIYGSGAVILLDEPDRTSLDIDVAAPYSRIDEADLRRAAAEAGLPVNPDTNTNVEHIEWVSALRLCLARPEDTQEIVLWRGNKLVVKTVSAADLVASKLIRYDDIDQGDIRYLVTQAGLRIDRIREAVTRLPQSFRNDALVRENLENLAVDIKGWLDTEEQTES